MRSRVEKPQRLEPRREGGEGEDGEVDGEVDLDEDQELLDGEIGLDSAEHQRDQNERDDDECE